jgi:hypothetical protein
MLMIFLKCKEISTINDRFSFYENNTTVCDAGELYVQ